MRGLLRLLGPPSVEGDDGGPVGRPRGRKPWAVLAYLACAERPVARERLAQLLFAEADDPLGALRWTLHEARRLLVDPAALTGDALVLDASVPVDVRLLRAASWREAEPWARDSGRLLEGLSFPAHGAFDAWLAGERAHLEALRAGVLRQAVLGRLACGDPAGAVASARALLGLDVLDEGAHVLLVRALVDAGAADEAEAAVDRCTRTFERELGAPPTPAVAAELRPRPPAALVPRRTTARALVEAGRAAVAAGVVDPGLDRLREACAVAASAGDVEGEVEALCALGDALVHAVRGRDDAGAAVLTRAVERARTAGRPELAVAAHRELGYIAFLAARYPQALRHLADADALGRPEEEAAIAAVRGAVLTEQAEYGAAGEELQRAVDAARAHGPARWLVWALTMQGRRLLLLDRPAEARVPLEEALRRCRESAWTSLVPWPQALLAEVDLRDGRAAEAEEAAGHAFALGCELRDPCWEATAGRVLAAVALEQGRRSEARALLLDAAARGVRVPDTWRFAHAQVLEALAGLGGDEPAAALQRVLDLERVAAAGGMRELAVRAQLHRAALGQVDALAAAVELAEGVDNPALRDLLTRRELPSGSAAVEPLGGR